MNGKKTQNPTSPHYWRVGDEMAFTGDWGPVQVKEHNGWRYIQAGGKVRLRSLPDKTGASEPIHFNYVFCYGFEKGPHPHYDSLLSDGFGHYEHMEPNFEPIDHLF